MLGAMNKTSPVEKGFPTKIFITDGSEIDIPLVVRGGACFPLVTAGGSFAVA